MNRKTGRLTASTIALAALVTMAGTGGLKASEDFRFFTIGTAATSGTYFPIGALIGNIISSPPGSRPCERGGSCGVPGLIAVAQSTQGSVENVHLISERRIDSALAQSDVATWAYTGTGIFGQREAIGNLRAIANLYPEDMHVVVRRDSGIETIAQLRGKRVAVGEEQSGTRVDAEIVLGHYGLGTDDIVASHDKPGIAADLLERGEIDAFFYVSGAPVTLIAQLAERLPINLLPIEPDEALDIRRDHPFFTASSIRAGDYAGVDPTPTLSVGAIWVIAAAVDEEQVYAITKALWHDANRSLLDNGHPKGIQIQPTTALDGLGIPLHPGANRYYRERGLID